MLGKSYDTWHERFVVIKEPGILYLFRDNDPGEKPQMVIDLSTVIEVHVHHSKKGKLKYRQFDIETADNTYTLKLQRGSPPDELEKWQASLHAWKEYHCFILQTNKQNKCRPIFSVTDAGAGWNNRFARGWIFDTYDARAGGLCRCRKQPVIVASFSQINRVVF